MAADGLLSIYAAIVSTSALLLNFKNWFDSGVKLKLSLMDNAKMFGGGTLKSSPDGQIALIVTNQGTATTTITHMVMLEFPSLYRGLRIRPARTALVLRRLLDRNIPVLPVSPGGSTLTPRIRAPG
jgi:hypothetical protein